MTTTDKLLSKIFPLFLILLFSVSLLTVGASDSATVTVSWQVPVMQSLQIQGQATSGSSDKITSVLNLPQPTDNDLQRGYIQRQNALTLTARSNVKWAVQVQVEQPYLGTSYDGEYRKPSSDLLIRGSSGYKQASTSPVIIATGESGSHRIGVDYKVLFDQQDYRRGDYQATLIYTITTRE